MNKQKIYKCQVTGYKIEYIINNQNHTATCGIIMCDYENMKAFLALLRSSIEQLKSNEGVLYIIQTVSDDEWINYLSGKTSWKIIVSDIKKNYKTHTIQCSIDDYLENYGVGLGL